MASTALSSPAQELARKAESAQRALARQRQRSRETLAQLAYAGETLLGGILGGVADSQLADEGETQVTLLGVPATAIAGGVAAVIGLAVGGGGLHLAFPGLGAASYGLGTTIREALKD